MLKMKKKTVKITAIVAAAALLVGGVFGGVTVNQKIAERNEKITAALDGSVTAYTKNTDDDILDSLLTHSSYETSDIHKKKKAYKVRVKVSAKDYGAAIRDFNEKNNSYLNEEQMHKDHLMLIDKAEQTEQSYTVTAVADDKAKDGYTVKLTPEFVNAMMGSVFSEKEQQSPDFLTTAVDNFAAATDIYVDLNYDYDKIDELVQAATTLARYEQRLYYSVTLEEGDNTVIKELRCYNIENGKDEKIASYTDNLDPLHYGVNYVHCLGDGALISGETIDLDGNSAFTASVYDYKEGKTKEIQCNPDMTMFTSDVYAAYKDGTVWYAEGQDGAGSVYRFTPEDTEAATAVTAEENGYLYLNALAVNDGKVYMGLLDEKEFEKSDHTTRKYNLCINQDTAVGETLVEGMDGRFCEEEEQASLLYFRDGALCRYSFKDGKETKLTAVKNHPTRADVRLVAGSMAYVVIYDDENHPTVPYIARVNLHNGHIKKLGNAAKSILYGY